MDEVVSELSKKQMEDVWTFLLTKSTTTLLSFDVEGEDQENVRITLEMFILEP